MNDGRASKWIVLWDLPISTRPVVRTFYRRLQELLEDYGGTVHCRATRSAYVVSGDGACLMAYAIAGLASAYGAGDVGTQGGVVVFPLGDVPAAVHFATLKEARGIVDRLCQDRRKCRRKHASTQRLRSSP